MINIYSEIEKRAWQKDPSKDASPETMLIYCIARAIYADFSEGNIEQEEAHKLKENLFVYYDMIQGLAHANSEIIRELSKATAPRAELTRKSKAELLDVIVRIEGVVTGLMKRYDDPIPKILKVEE